MKLFATVVVVVVVTVAQCTGQTEEEAERIRRNRDSCILETKVDPELITRADAGDFVDDEKLKCFTKCFYQKAGFVSENGDLLMEVIEAKLPTYVDKEKALKVVDSCKQTGKDACETVYLVHKCYFEYTQKNNLAKETAEKAVEEKKVEAQPEGQKITASETKA